MKETEPLPLALAPPLTEIQLSPLKTDQLQPSGEVTSTLPTPPSESKLTLVKERERLQSILLWVIVKTRSSTVIVPDRGSVEELASTVKDTEPLPLPLDPVPIVIQLSLLDADHSQP